MKGNVIFAAFGCVFAAALVFYLLAANLPGIYVNPLPAQVQAEGSQQGENASEGSAGAAAGNDEEEKSYSFPDTPAYTPPDAGENPTVSKLPEGSTINLNDATLLDFMKLPGVGQATAQKIVDYRESIGGRFTSVEQLLEVNGIGEKKLEAIRPYVTV